MKELEVDSEYLIDGKVYVVLSKAYISGFIVYEVYCGHGISNQNHKVIAHSDIRAAQEVDFSGGFSGLKWSDDIQCPSFLKHEFEPNRILYDGENVFSESTLYVYNIEGMAYISTERSLVDEWGYIEHEPTHCMLSAH